MIKLRMIQFAQLLFAVAALLSLSSGWQSITQPAFSGCVAGASCQEIQSSPWAWIGPLPVAWLGALVYGVQFFAIGRWRKQAQSTTSGFLTLLLGANFAAALFFGFIQGFVMGKWCPWCCVIHGLACSGAILAIRDISIRATASHSSPTSSFPVVRRVSLGIMASLMLLVSISVFAQIVSPQAEAKRITAETQKVVRTQEGKSPMLLLHEGKFRFNLNELPILGDPQAKHVIVCITDPSCSYCRVTSQTIQKAWEAQPAGEVAIVFLPGTRDPLAGPALQALLLTLWKEQPETWKRITKEIEEEKLAAELEAVRASVAEALGGRDKLDAIVRKHQEWSSSLISQTSALMVENAKTVGGVVALPQTQYDGQLMVGAITDSADLKELTKGEVTWAETTTSPKLAESDPCKRRKFCGNLTIIFNGAGENLADDPKNKGVDPSARDTVLYLENAQKIQGANNQILLFSSDSTQAVAKAIQVAKKKKGKNFTHAPTSKPSFDAYLKNDAALEKMKASFAKDPECARLINANPGSDISRFIKVEFWVASHSINLVGKFIGLPVWPANTDRGEDNRHSELASSDLESANPQTILQDKDFDQFRTAFSDSVIQAIVITCDAVDVADMVAPVNSDSCSCFIGYTDRGVVSVVNQYNVKSVSADSLSNSDHGNSLLTFANPMQNYNRWALMGSGPKGLINDYDSPIFTIETKKENHFDLFALTSADVYSSDVLATTPAKDSSEVKLKSANVNSDKDFEVAYKEIEALAKRAESQNNAYLATLGRDPNALKRSREEARDFFNTCVHEPKPDDRMCIGFKELIETIDSKKAESLDYEYAIGWLGQVKLDLSEMANYPLMEGKNDDPVANLAKYRKYWENFANFRNSLTRAAIKLGRADEVVAPMEQMSTKWSTYHSSYISAYFPDVVGDTLKRRVENYVKAAELLKAQYSATGDPKYRIQLFRLRSHLKCVLNFPIGPNYKDVQEFPGE